MGKRGPAPAPTALKLVRGDRASRVNDAEPLPDDEEILPPEWLRPEAIEVWNEYGPRLERKHVLTSWDVEQFAGWCDAVVLRRIAAKHLETEGAVVEQKVFNRQGTEEIGSRSVRSEWLGVWKDANSVIAQIGARYGMTPSERGQLKVDDGRSKNPKGRLLSG